MLQQLVTQGAFQGKIFLVSSPLYKNRLQCRYGKTKASCPFKLWHEIGLQPRLVGECARYIFFLGAREGIWLLVRRAP